MWPKKKGKRRKGKRRKQGRKEKEVEAVSPPYPLLKINDFLKGAEIAY